MLILPKYLEEHLKGFPLLKKSLEDNKKKVKEFFEKLAKERSTSKK